LLTEGFAFSVSVGLVCTTTGRWLCELPVNVQVCLLHLWFLSVKVCFPSALASWVYGFLIIVTLPSVVLTYYFCTRECHRTGLKP